MIAVRAPATFEALPQSSMLSAQMNTLPARSINPIGDALLRRRAYLAPRD